MKRRIILGIIFLCFFPFWAGTICLATDSASLKSRQPLEVDLDSRSFILFSFLKENKSSLASYSGDFIQVADKYNLDWRLLPAIAGLESNFGKRMIRGSFNPFGWGGGYFYFEDWRNGFEHVAEGLNKAPYPKNKNPEFLGPVYAPPNPNWGILVRQIMNRIAVLP